MEHEIISSALRDFDSTIEEHKTTETYVYKGSREDYRQGTGKRIL